MGRNFFDILFVRFVLAHIGPHWPVHLCTLFSVDETIRNALEMFGGVPNDRGGEADVNDNDAADRHQDHPFWGMKAKRDAMHLWFARATQLSSAAADR